LALVLLGAFGRSFSLRVASPPAQATFLARGWRPLDRPRQLDAVPATDGTSIWLPSSLANTDAATALERFRCMALQQAMRAVRGSAAHVSAAPTPSSAALYLLLEARAADAELVRMLPGLRPGLGALRLHALARRPPLSAFPASRRPLELLARSVLQAGLLAEQDEPFSPSPRASLDQALELASRRPLGAGGLFPDLWTGELKSPPTAAASEPVHFASDDSGRSLERPKSARMGRRPDVRKPDPNEDDERPGAWMVQTTAPHEQVEDPMGLQRPTDRGKEVAAEDHADALSELREARLVTTPGQPKEILFADDGSDAQAHADALRVARDQGTELSYPEWDFRRQMYRTPGATVRLVAADLGPEAWIARTLREHQAMHDAIRRRFEMLRAHRQRLRKQQDGDDIDLEAWVEAYSDFKAHRPMPQGLYQSQRRVRAELAISLLIDVSGSTDAWLAGQRRVIDVEREALLLCCAALEAMHEPYNVLAFSGEGPTNVTLSAIKRFDEPYGIDPARRIAGLEPERYTRAGAAIRHATALLMKQQARHRLLLLLSDGKPNDVDDYDGRHGLEDTKRAVIEARLAGIFPFCLTIDRSAADYLPYVFGASQYALLPRPELLPGALLEWMRRLSAN
jgi:nitric oxide reductase NorD protein